MPHCHNIGCNWLPTEHIYYHMIVVVRKVCTNRNGTAIYH